MSEAATDTSRPLDLPEHARGRRGLPTLLRQLLGVLLIIQGSLMVFALFAATGARPSNGLQFPPAWPKVPEGLVTVAVGAFLWRGDVSRIRIWLAMLLFAKGFTSAVTYFHLVPHLPPGWFFAFQAIACPIIGVGIWRAAEWGRRCSVILGLALYGCLLSFGAHEMRSTLGHRPNSLSVLAIIGIPVIIMAVAPPIALAIYGILPSTRREFATARFARRLMSS